MHSSVGQANSILIIGILTWSQNSLLLDASILVQSIKKMKYFSPGDLVSCDSMRLASPPLSLLRHITHDTLRLINAIQYIAVHRLAV